MCFQKKISDVIFGNTSDQIFIVDRENNRIIECNESKFYKRQWVNKDFVDIRSVFYDSNSDNLYVLTSLSIFEINVGKN